MPTLTPEQAQQTAWELLRAGRTQEAGGLFQQLVNALPANADAWHGLGYVCYLLGNLADAVKCFTQAVRLQPQSAEYHYLLATTLHHHGQADEALPIYERAVALGTQEPGLYVNLGSIHSDRNNFDVAEAMFRKALALNPHGPNAYTNLGNLRKKQKRLEEAIAFYRQAIAQDANFYLPYYNLGTTYLEEKKDFEQAMIWLEQGQKLNSKHPELLHNLGLSYQVQGDLAQACVWYDRALALNPSLYETCKNLGTIAFTREDYPLAERYFLQTLKIRPTCHESHNFLGGVYQKTRVLDKSLAYFQKSLELKPDYVDGLNNLIQTKQYLCDWHGLDALIAQQRRALNENRQAKISPFSILGIESTAQEQLLAANQWNDIVHEPMKILRKKLDFRFTPGPRKRLRVGYVSGDYFNHAVAYLMGELFELHDRSQVEVIAYSYGPDDKSAIRKRIETTCDRFVEQRELSTEDAARQIHADKVDILVDLKGHTGHDRCAILALHPGAIQVEWLGYPGTMGGDYFEYVIADRYIVTPESEPYFSEKVVKMPGCYQINDRQRVISERTPTRAECGLPATGFVFCDFNRPFKFSPLVFDQWMRLLREIPGSVLWLLWETTWAEQNVRREAALRGIDPGRIVFAKHLYVSDHLARYRLADLAIDTYPYTSHTTASDALWVGCPVLTRVGKTFVTRVSGSILTNVGVPELITHTPAEFEARALELARDPEQLRRIRQKILAQRDTCPLFDSRSFASQLESAYRTMWHRFETGQPPQAFEVKEWRKP